jgi:hypothetical protein
VVSQHTISFHSHKCAIFRDVAIFAIARLREKLIDSTELELFLILAPFSRTKFKTFESIMCALDIRETATTPGWAAALGGLKQTASHHNNLAIETAQSDYPRKNNLLALLSTYTKTYAQQHYKSHTPTHNPDASTINNVFPRLLFPAVPEFTPIAKLVLTGNEGRGVEFRADNCVVFTARVCTWVGTCVCVGRLE